MAATYGLRCDSILNSSRFFHVTEGLSPDITHDILEGACPQVESCDQCQRNNKKLQKASGVLHPVPVTSKIWHQVGMDLIDPLTETPRGNKYIITLTDYFSKWAEAAPLQDKTAIGVAQFIYSVS